MKKITNPRKEEGDGYTLTGGINYSKTGGVSIWGTGDKDTLGLLDKTGISGRWLNLAAGDGRYNLHLLKKADFVVASDIDGGALSKLWQTTPKEYRGKLQIKVFDIAKRFPFRDGFFDGVFCTGTLHLSPREVLLRIFGEINRVLKPRGEIIIDLATDIRRVLPDGRLYFVKNEPQYDLGEGKRLLKEMLKNYELRLYESEVPEEEIRMGNRKYKFSSRFILAVGRKK